MRDIGVDVKAPVETCEGDDNCPFHGKLRLRGQIIEGIVASNNMQGSIVLERKDLRYNQKYERYEKRTSRIPAHAPSCIPLNVGDSVRIMECKPLSKTIRFCVIEGGGAE